MFKMHKVSQPHQEPFRDMLIFGGEIIVRQSCAHIKAQLRSQNIIKHPCIIIEKVSKQP